MGPDLCPLEGRRTTTELWVKLAVVHFTTISAFCHLLSLRREPFLSWKFLFYILWPPVMLIQYALAIFVLLLVALSWIIFGVSDKRIKLWIAIKMFFAKVPRENGGNYTILPTGEPVPGRTCSWKVRKFDSAAKRIGRIVLTMGFLTQSVGTIYIYRRRVAQGADTLADRRIAELGSTGLLIGLFTLLILLKIPPFASTAPELQGDEDGINVAMIYLRDTIAGPFSYGRLDDRYISSLVYNGMISLPVLSLHPNTVGFVKSMAPTFDRSDLVTILYIFAFYGILSAVASLIFLLIQRLRSASWTKALLWWQWILIPCAAFILPTFFTIMSSTAFALMCPFTIYFSFLVTIGLSISNFVSIGIEVQRVAFWPTDIICPQLWTDPQASWIWMLA